MRCGLFQFLPAQHQLGTRLVIELRGDVKTLGFGEDVARYFVRSTVRLNDGSGCQCKFAFTWNVAYLSARQSRATSLSGRDICSALS